MIYGLIASLGWGCADYAGAVAARRVGSLATVLVGQGFNAIAVTALLLAQGPRLDRLGPVAGWIAVNGIVSAVAYSTHYRALELGPVTVVSPVGAAYALFGTALAIVVLHERPGPVALTGAAVVIVGVMLCSTDLRRLRREASGRPAGLPWALASAVFFGVGGFSLGLLAQRVGWVEGLWASRVAQFAMFCVFAGATRIDLSGIGANASTGWALATGLADLLGVVMFSSGSTAGYVSIVLVASAVFPLIAVALSVLLLGERPVANQYAGAVVVVGGLLLLGLGR